MEDLRVIREELACVEQAYVASRTSRIGNLVTLWATTKAAFSERRQGRQRFALGKIDAVRSPGFEAEARVREFHEASSEEIQRLQREVGALARELEDARSAVAATAADRDAERETHFALRSTVGRLQSALDVTARDLALADEMRRTALEKARAAGLERDAAAETAQTFQNELETIRDAPVHRIVSSTDSRFSAAIAEKRDRLERILGAERATLGSLSPDVSLIVPAYNQAEMTLDCLTSVAAYLEDGPTIQIIVVDDASSDEPLSTILSGLSFVTVLRNGSNLGFLRSCNAAAGIARGRYVHFLNNDTLVQPEWLMELVHCADADDTIGAVGSRLLFADGSLQEAGGIIWRDASGWNYGRSDDPEDARYNYTRDVDYLSGASLLVRTSVFRRLGGFDEAYAPAYFEDSDLCFQIRAAGMRVVYHPKSTVVHLEGVSSGTSVDSGIKRHQAINKPTFANKWRDALTSHFEPDAAQGIRAARRLQKSKTLVMIDNYVPEYDKDSGSNKLFNFIKLFGELGYSVIYVPDNYQRSEPYTTSLQNLGVEVLYASRNRRDLPAALRERLAFADVVWMGRPDLGDRYLPIVREFPDVPVLYDTHDLHYVRVRRELELHHVHESEKWLEWERLRNQELRVVREADIAMTVTDVEKRVLEAEGVEHVFVMPNVHDSYGRKTPYDERDGIIFIGGYVHGPNVDAVLWLCHEIMPIVWRTHPQMRVRLIGSNAPPEVFALASDRVEIPGFVRDVEPYFERARLMIAPLRYGAGLKGKIGHAFAYELPVVTTPIGAEGFDIENGGDALVEETAAGLAQAIVRAYDDRELWETLSRRGAQLVKRFNPNATRDRLGAAVLMAYKRRAATRATEAR